MAKVVKKKDILWGYGAQAFNVGAGLLLLPVALHFLSPADVGLWFVFITLGGLAQLLEMGFQPTIARNTAYIFAGANSLVNEGVPNDSILTSDIDVDLFAKLISCSRNIYRWIALASVFLLLGGGSIYVNSVLVETQNRLLVVFGWVLFSFGHIVTFYFGYINALLQGRGDVSQANKVVVITKGGFAVLGSLALMLDYGLVGLGIASLLSAGIGRIFAIHYLVRDQVTLTALIKAPSTDTGELLPIMWHNAKRTATVQFSAFIIQRSNILIGTSFLGPVIMASYSMTITILMTLSTISSVICQVKLPYLISLQMAEDKRKIRSLYFEFVSISATSFIFGSIFVGLFGNSLLQFVGSKVELLPIFIFCILVVINLLELHHVIAAIYITTLNAVPFVRAAVFSSVFTLVLTFLLIEPLGILGLVLSQGVVQLLYNNWKWPFVVYRHLYRKA